MSLARLAKERKQILEGGGNPAGNTTAALLVNPTISPALRRIRGDLDSVAGVASKVTVDLNDPYRVEVDVNPKNGIWQGGRFCFAILFTDQYPFEGPKVRYTGPYRVFHPNIEGDDGQKDWGVCLGLQTDWRPAYTIKELVFGLEMLFSDPSFENPLPGIAKEAALMLRDRPEEFKRKAQAWMRGDYR